MSVCVCVPGVCVGWSAGGDHVAPIQKNLLAHDVDELYTYMELGFMILVRSDDVFKVNPASQVVTILPRTAVPGLGLLLPTAADNFHPSRLSTAYP